MKTITDLDYYPEPMLMSDPIRVQAKANPRPTGITSSRKASPQYGSAGRQGRYTNPPTGSALEKWDREVAVFEARKAGWSFMDIAQQLGINDATARKDFRDFITRRDNDASMKLTAFRELQTSRLEALLQAVWPFATEPDGVQFSQFLKANVRAQDLIREMTELWGLKPDGGAQSQIGQLLVDARIQTIVGMSEEEIHAKLRDIGPGERQRLPTFGSGVGEASGSNGDGADPDIVEGEVVP